ncbi:replicative DNA helicase [Clostridium sp. 'deep sea']|uniref:replicative DNA helicase n=1 Tax=Clostridium sp. 'deep sea' TaxID=2779445 RepID=UPI00189654B3|nr:replicative DNA helicase [Clostridium sp. 'deep sea']QOR33873.1 replicative DNA helicase [Clostridium sp. 'deep sea']
MAEPVQRIPPQNSEAEQSVLAAMLVDKESLLTGIEKLLPEYFYKDNHRLIFKAMIELEENNQAVDIITLIEQLRKKKQLDDAGGIIYLTEMSSLAPLVGNVTEYCRIVHEKAMLRHLITIARELADESFSNNEFDDILDNAEKKLFEISQQRDTRSYQEIKDVIKETFASIEESFRNKGKMTGLRTGFTDFDDMTNGLQKAALIIIAARPSMGKSALMLNMAQNIALREKTGVMIFSLEMPNNQLVHRMLCSEAKINSMRVQKGFIEENEWGKLSKAVAMLGDSPIYFDDTPGISILELRSKARRLKSEKDIGLIIVDYLQLITTPNKNESRQQEIAYITRQIKELARELDIPIIALAQLSRAVESRQDKRPMLSDLRESGEIEQTADIVSFIYRDDYYDPDSENANIAEIIIGKNRNGPTGRVELMFAKHLGRFENLSKRDD